MNASAPLSLDAAWRSRLRAVRPLLDALHFSPARLVLLLAVPLLYCA